MSRADLAGAVGLDIDMVVIVGAAGVRMCDPHFASTDPTGCP